MEGNRKRSRKHTGSNKIAGLHAKGAASYRVWTLHLFCTYYLEAEAWVRAFLIAWFKMI